MLLLARSRNCVQEPSHFSRPGTRTEKLWQKPLLPCWAWCSSHTICAYLHFDCIASLKQQNHDCCLQSMLNTAWHVWLTGIGFLRLSNWKHITLLLLQTDQSQVDLATNLGNIGRKSTQSLQQIYALFDGTAESLQTIPEIELFSSSSAGEH